MQNVPIPTRDHHNDLLEIEAARLVTEVKSLQAGQWPYDSLSRDSRQEQLGALGLSIIPEPADAEQLLADYPGMKRLTDAQLTDVVAHPPGLFGDAMKCVCVAMLLLSRRHSGTDRRFPWLADLADDSLCDLATRVKLGAKLSFVTPDQMPAFKKEAAAELSRRLNRMMAQGAPPTDEERDEIEDRLATVEAEQEDPERFDGMA